MSGVEHSAAFEAIAAALAGRTGVTSDEVMVESLGRIVFEVESHEDVFRLVMMLSMIGSALVARLAVLTGVEPGVILQEMALGWAADDGDDAD